MELLQIKTALFRLPSGQRGWLGLGLMEQETVLNTRAFTVPAYAGHPGPLKPAASEASFRSRKSHFKYQAKDTSKVAACVGRRGVAQSGAFISCCLAMTSSSYSLLSPQPSAKYTLAFRHPPRVVVAEVRSNQVRNWSDNHLQ